MLFMGNRKGYVAVRQSAVVKLAILSFLKVERGERIWKAAPAFIKGYEEGALEEPHANILQPAYEHLFHELNRLTYHPKLCISIPQASSI